MSDNGFTRQFAIQMPNGELLMRANYGGMPSITKMLGLTNSDDDNVTYPRVFDTAEAAKSELDSIQTELRRKGIEWLGVVVQRLCTPFTLVDPAEHFASEVQQWLDGRAS